jgi:hypothetical protein
MYFGGFTTLIDTYSSYLSKMIILYLVSDDKSSVDMRRQNCLYHLRRPYITAIKFHLQFSMLLVCGELFHHPQIGSGGETQKSGKTVIWCKNHLEIGLLKLEKKIKV